MLSVGSRDEGMKRSVLGLEGSGGTGGRKMMENEIEEGEAYSVQDNHIDPDALSYIDEKLQHVLGHFQKEFEAGVSAETLGAKFGGYGSFLPVYQRSPPVTLSQPKSPAKVPGLNLLRSPHNLQPEVECKNASVIANASIAKANGASVAHPSVKYGKRETSISSCSTEGAPQHESTRKTLNPKSLKVRIKVGPGNALIKNKPEIYSDLGLDISPSPSLEDSPNGSRELSPDAFVESPSTILQVMTCFPVPGSCFLSPLSETLLHFLEKEDSLVTNIKKNTPHNVVTENTTSDTSVHAKDVRNFTHKEKKSSEKGRKSVKAQGMTNEDVINASLKNGSGRRSPAAQKVASSTQDIGLPSNAWCVDAKEEIQLGGNSIKEHGKMFDVPTETNKIPVIEKVQALDFRKDNYIEFIDSGKVDGAYKSDKESVPSKGKTSSKPHIVEKTFEETNGNFDTATKSKSKSQRHHHKNKSDSGKYRMGKDRSAGFEEHVKEQPAQKVCSSENKMIQDKDQFMEDEKTIRGSQNETLFNEPNKKKQNIPFSEPRKGIKKKLHVKGSQLETMPKISKSQKEVNKGHNTASQNEPLPNAQAQQAENGTQIFGSSMSTEKSNEKVEVNKVDNFHINGPVTDVTAPLIDSVSKNEAVPALVLIEDNWVCCDICQRWRLLPYGTNPDSLPKKWHCSMQVWLPGLNNCNVSQDETTKAFHELYQFPAPGNDTNVTAHPSATASSITSAGTPNPGRRLENVMHNAPANGKKKYVSMDATDLPKDSSLTNLPNSSKNLLASSGNKDLYEVNYSTEMGSSIKPKPGWTNRSTNFSGEKHMHKQDKLTAASSCKVGGDLSERSNQNSKPMSKRAADFDSHKASKKLKKDGSYHLPKDLHSNFDTSGKMAANGDNEMLAKVPKNILQNYSDYSSKDLKSKSGSSKKSREEHKEISSASEAEKSRKYDFKDKKGKLKERQESKICKEISMSSQQITGSRLKLKEAHLDGEMRRQHSAKLAKPDGKESRAVIGVGNIDIKGCSTKKSLSRNRKYLPDGIDNVGLHTATDEQLVRSLATTSSSSKVSGSQMGKVNVPELRGSPVESVSSSPFRLISTENNTARRNSIIKDNVLSIGYSGMGSPKRYSDGDFDGSSDQSGTRAKDQSSNDCHRASEIYKSAESVVHDSLKGSHDYEDTETRRLTCVKSMDGRHSKIVKPDDVISTDIGKANTVCDSGNVPRHPKKYHLERSGKNPACDEDERYGSGLKNYGKSSLHSREKLRSLNFDTDKSKLKGTVTEQKDLHSTKTSNKRHADTEFDNINSSKKINLTNHTKQYKAHELSPAISGETKGKHTSQQNLQHASSHERQNSSVLLAAEAVEQSVMVTDKLGKKVCTQTAPEFKKGGNIEKLPVDAQNSEALKSAKPSRKLDEQNGNLANVSRQPTSSVPGSSSPVKKDGHSVNIFIKEARDLKHTANRFKSLGMEDESSGIFFESALKFLHASYLLEPSNTESTRQGEQVPSPQMLQMYYDTAKFCEFCAHEYERLKEMAAAALAYKCAEVAYLKVAYYKHPGASKDRVDLQIALDAPMPGESPSSSASDVDNLNNQGGVDKIASTKAVSSPQVAGNHAIAARNRPHVIRLLTYTNYLNCAFEATRKSQSAIAAASTDLGKSGIDVCSSRKVLDFNFHNVEGLLRLIRLSMNSVGH